MSNTENKPTGTVGFEGIRTSEIIFLNKQNDKKDKEELESINYDIIDKKTNADDNLSTYFIDLMEFPKIINIQLVRIFRDFLFRFIKFYGIRALVSLIKKAMKLKFRINKFSLKDFFDILFNTGNLRTGVFLSIMPFIFSLLTEVLFDVNNKRNYSRENLKGEFNYNYNLKNKLIVFLSGFVAAFIGISSSEKGVKIMNYIILSIMVRAIHSMIVVYLKNKGKETDSKFWAFITFYIACFGFLFLAYFHPGYKPIFKLFSNYANFEGN
jgi:hypothetical protein